MIVDVLLLYCVVGYILSLMVGPVWGVVITLGILLYFASNAD